MSIHEITYHLMETERYPIFPQLLERSSHPFTEKIQLDFALEMLTYYQDIFNAVKQVGKTGRTLLAKFFIPKLEWEPEERGNGDDQESDAVEFDDDAPFVPTPRQEELWLIKRLDLVRCIVNWLSNINSIFDSDESDQQMLFLAERLATQVLKFIDALISHQGSEQYTEDLIKSNKAICKNIK